MCSFRVVTGNVEHGNSCAFLRSTLRTRDRLPETRSSGTSVEHWDSETTIISFVQVYCLSRGHSGSFGPGPQHALATSRIRTGRKIHGDFSFPADAGTPITIVTVSTAICCDSSRLLGFPLVAGNTSGRLTSHNLFLLLIIPSCFSSVGLSGRFFTSDPPSSVVWPCVPPKPFLRTQLTRPDSGGGPMLLILQRSHTRYTLWGGYLVGALIGSISRDTHRRPLPTCHASIHARHSACST